MKLYNFLLAIAISACCLFDGTALGQNVANSRLLVPQISQENYQLTPETNGQYRLVIKLPDGSERQESARIVEPDTPEAYVQFMGEINELFENGASVVTIYEAGIDGYRAKYSYKNVRLLPLHVSINGLKSAAG